MLTSIKESLNEERFYDAVSNRINSTVLDYSPISELENESKTLIEDSYKDLRPNIAVMTKVSTESMEIMEKLTKDVYPSYNKINSMRGSFSTEGAFQDFLSMALQKFVAFIDKIVETVLKIWYFIKTVCANVKKFLLMIFKINSPLTKNATELKRWLSKNNMENVQVSDILSVSSPDTGKIELKVFDDIDSSTSVGSTKFNTFVDKFNKCVCEIKPGGYISRMKERSKALQRIVDIVNKFSEDALSAIDNESDDTAIEKTISSLQNDMRQEVSHFFKFIDDVHDLNGWVIREYKIKAPHENNGMCAWEDVFTDKLIAHQLVDNLKHNKTAVLSKVNNLKDADSIYSLYSPLTASDIKNKVDCPTVSERTYNVKDLFGNITCGELMDIILDVSKNAEASTQVFKKDVSPLSSVTDTLDKCSKTSIDAVSKYRSELNSISATEDSLAIRRVMISMIMKLFQDVNFSSMTMNNIILEDVFNRSKVSTDVLKSLNTLLMTIKTSANKYLEK